MAQAFVKFLDVSGNLAGGVNQRNFYSVAWLGTDVPEEIASGLQTQIEVEIDSNWNLVKRNASIAAAVIAKATELGLTVVEDDVLGVSYKAKRELIRNPNLKGIWLQREAGAATGTVSVGTQVAPSASGTPVAIINDPTGQYTQYTSAAGPANCGWITGVVNGFMSLKNEYREIFVFKTPADITNYRLWVGVVSGSPMGSDTPAVSLTAFRGSTSAGDSNLMLCTGDGATQTTEDSGVPFLADTRYELGIDASETGEVSFYSGGVFKGTLTTDLPVDTTMMGLVLLGRTLVAGTRAILISHKGGESL